MTDREQLLREVAHGYAMQFLEIEDQCGMIKGTRLRGSQEKRMRRYVNKQLRNHSLDDGKKFSSMELWIFAIATLAKIIYAAWKVWQDRHAVADGYEQKLREARGY